MAAQRIIGIDFGTSTSVIRVKRYENGAPIGETLETKEVIFGGSGALVPTLIMKKNDDPSACYYGHEVQQKKKNYTVYQNFKMDLESTDPALRAQARALTEEFYGFLAKQYRAQSDGGHLGSSDDKESTIISYPVKWQEETKEFMLETARKAGFSNVTGMDEAQAAIQAVIVMSTDHLKKHGLLQNGKKTNILLIDMGAGTTDLVLASFTPGAENIQVLNTWPKCGELQFGGREIDHLLQNFFRDKLEEGDVQLVLRRVGADKFKSWKEYVVSPALLKNDPVCEFDALDSCVDMGDMEMEEYCLDRAAFEDCLEGYLQQFPRLINGCLEDAAVAGSDVDLVIVTGGHSQWYFVQDMLCGKMNRFGGVDLPRIRENAARIIPISRPQETVALGLAFSGLRPDFAGEAPQERRQEQEKLVESLGAVLQQQKEADRKPQPEETPTPIREQPQKVFAPVQPVSQSGVNWEEVSNSAKATAEEAKKGLEKYTQEVKDTVNALNMKLYTIPEGKSIPGTVYMVKAFFASKKMEYQYFCKDNCHIIQARNQTSGIAKLAGGSRAVEVRLTELKDNRVGLNVGGGKWVDKAAGAVLSTLTLGPLIPIGMAMYGANMWMQAKLIEDCTKTIERYLSC